MTATESQWLVYEVGGQAYRTPASRVQSIEPFRAGEPLPVEGPFEGVVAVQGKLVAVLRVSPGARPTRLVVVRTGDGLVGVASDAVRGIEPLEGCQALPALDEEDLLARAAGRFSPRTG